MDSKALTSAIAKFSAKFCNELDKGKSVVSSPLSAEILLALLTLGSTEPSHSQLLKALGIPDDDSIRSSFSSLSAQLKSVKGVTFDVANKIYLKDGPYELATNLEADATKVFNAGIEKVNFADSVRAANLINSWVASQTNNKIKDLLSSDSLDDDTRMVLVNALYFKGSWSKKFNPSFTKDKNFHVTASKTIQVPMMYREDEYRFGQSEKLEAQLLEMSYQGEEASMVIILPYLVDGLNTVLQKLADGHDLASDLEAMFKTKVQVTIPKFKIETEIDLAQVLPKLGISSIFDQTNSGLDNLLKVKEPLFVSKAVQKAFIEVNEEGAEAAAATAMGIALCCAMLDPPPTPQFVADRPFLVAILLGGTPNFFAMYRGA